MQEATMDDSAMASTSPTQRVTRARPVHLQVLREGRAGHTPIVAVGLNDSTGALREAPPDGAPLWWLRLDGFHGPPDVIRPVPEIAAAFARELEDHYPAGPLVLLGYSFCALVAIEMALLLQARGRDPIVLALEPPMPGILPTCAKRRRVVLAAAPGTAGPTEPAAEGPLAWLARKARYAAHPASLARRLLRRGRDSALRPYRELWLRPRLYARVARGQPLFDRHRDWWYYFPQVSALIKGYQFPNQYPGRVHLAGRVDWLASYLPTWEVLIAPGGPVPCPLPLSPDHQSIVRLPGAGPWLDLLELWTWPAAD